MSVKTISLYLVFFLSLFVLINISEASITYRVEKAINDETFIINNHVYKSQTYCFNVMDDDQVAFIEGSAFGACVSAKFLNLRTNATCAVWCE